MKVEKYALIEIGRSHGASYIKHSNFEEHVLKLLLIESLPSGDPVDDFVRFFFIDDRKFLSVLKLHKTEDYGIALVIEATDELLSYPIIGLVDDMRSKLEKKLSTPDFEFPEQLDLEYKELSFDFDEFESLDEFFYALLADEPIIIVGEPKEMEKILSAIFQFFPKSKNARITLTANTTKLDPNVLINCLIETDDVLSLIDEKIGKYTIMYLPYKKVFGKATSPISKKSAELFIKKDKDGISKLLDEFLKKILAKQEIENPADVAEQYGLHLADAKLMMIIRSNIFKLELPKNVLEM